MSRPASTDHLASKMSTALRDDRPTPKELLQHIADNTPAKISTPNARLTKVDGIAIGTLVAISGDGRACLSIPDIGLADVWTNSVVALQAHHIGQQVAVAFEAGDSHRPIVMGVLVGGANTPKQEPAPTIQTDIVLDGERVVLTAVNEIELRCGEAALILSADGHIQLRGTYITSQASATQRILGGSVNVN